MVTIFFKLTCSVMLWRRRNTAIKYYWCVWGVLTVSHHTCFAPAHSMCAFPVYTAQVLGSSAGNCLRLALSCRHFPGLSHTGSGSPVLHKGLDLVGPAFCALLRSKSQVQVLRYSTKAQTWLGLCFVPIPGPSGEGNGTPLQYSCLENPMDGGAW